MGKPQVENGLKVILHFEILYQFEKYEKNVGKIWNPFELLFRMREKYISKHSSSGNSSSSLSWWL
jgi:hypothetical protein